MSLLKPEQPRKLETAQAAQQPIEITDQSDSARKEQSESTDRGIATRWTDEDATWSSLHAIENAIQRLELDNR